jgi:hypothetical protein
VATLGAWAIARGERRRVVEEEELRISTGAQQVAVTILEPQPTGDPEPARVAAPNPTFVVVEASAIAEHEPSPRVGDDLTEGCHAVAARHAASASRIPVAEKPIHVHTAGDRLRENR